MNLTIHTGKMITIKGRQYEIDLEHKRLVDAETGKVYLEMNDEEVQYYREICR